MAGVIADATIQKVAIAMMTKLRDMNLFSIPMDIPS
jgi:hypothetical protein